MNICSVISRLKVFSIGAGIAPENFYTNIDIESCLRTKKIGKKAVIFINLY